MKDVNTDKILVNVFAARTKSKEGVSVGKFNFETKSLKADHGYQAPRDKWDALHDGQVGPNQNSFIRYIVQLVPSGMLLLFIHFKDTHFHSFLTTRY